MRSIASCLLVVALACGTEPPPEESATPATPSEGVEPPTTDESESPATPEEPAIREVVGAGEGFNRAMLGAFISVGDPIASFTPMPGSRFHVSDGVTHVDLRGSMGWALRFQVPTGPPDGATDEAQNRFRTEPLHMRVTDGEGVEYDVQGHVVITALEPSSGRLGFTVEGQTAEGGLSVEAEADTRITPLEP